MSLNYYTSFDDVRAALGVTSDELQDDTLSLNLYEFGLTAELEDIALALPSQFNLIKSKPSPSDVETRFLSSAQVFSTYAVARQLLSSLPLFSFKEVSDGKASDTRFSLDPYKQTSLRIEEQYDRFKLRLSAAFAGLSAGTVVATRRNYMSVASPSADPVTGT